MNWNCF